VAVTRSDLAALLAARGIRPRRSLGQHFLVDPNFLDALVRDAELEKSDGVVEIGAGPGNLTERLAEAAGRVWAFEIDPALFELASERLAGRGNVRLFGADGADFERVVDPPRDGRLKAVSNLPYAPWKRLLLRLLSSRLPFESYTLMLQRDAAERLRARPGTKDYGPLPALVQATCEMTTLRRAGRGLFLPPPRVESAVIRLRRRGPARDLEAAERRLRKLFAGRRKKSAAAGGRRIETLGPAELLALGLGEEEGDRGG
jgi:16S rRNA (adenine1518-N6/adenine1519-N6)-dimethyltransferase